MSPYCLLVLLANTFDCIEINTVLTHSLLNKVIHWESSCLKLDLFFPQFVQDELHIPTLLDATHMVTTCLENVELPSFLFLHVLKQNM